MNTKPDELQIALWLEDELCGADQERVDAWAATQPELLRQREELRSWKGWMKQALEPAAAVPHAEFFHARVAREIRRPAETAAPARPQRRGWEMAAMAACMVLCFWLGSRYGGPSRVMTAGTIQPAAAPIPVLYTPERGVEAEAFASEAADATVIVLQGVDALPDSFEIPDTVGSLNENSSVADIPPAL